MGFCTRFNKHSQGFSPSIIFDFRNVPPIELKSPQELIESESGMTRHLTDPERRRGRRESCRDNDSSYVVNRHHVDSVRYAWSAEKLHTTLQHSDQEVVGVRHCLLVSRGLVYVRQIPHLLSLSHR